MILSCERWITSKSVVIALYIETSLVVIVLFYFIFIFSTIIN